MQRRRQIVIRSGAPLFNISFVPDTSKTSKETSICIFAVHWFAPSGAEYYALECARLASLEGFQIIWVVDFPSNDGHWVSEFIKISPYVVQVWKQESPIVAVAERLSLINGRVKAIHIHHSVFAYEHLVELKKLCPQACIIDSTHIVELMGGGFPDRSLRAGNSIDIRNVISKGLCDYYITQGVQPLSLYRTAIVPDKPNFVSKVGRASGFSIGVIGRLSQQKRPYLLPVFLRELDRVLTLNNISGKVDFFVYGYGPYAEYLRSLLRFKYIDVYVKEHCYDRNEIYNDLDCVIQLSENEGVSIVSYESASYGVPFLATDVGQQREMVHPELLLPAQPRKAIKRAVEIVLSLIIEPERSRQIVAWQYQRLKFLKHHYGYNSRMRELYRRLLI